ncbi:acyltransferase domain-containing protein [Aerococcus sanguinicola]|uniref:acyltransferase domain-containing protein n=1 Tax=unclassified Aerococcus TaxID=2618060 RepID=UPI0008A1F803|nr:MULTISPECIES: acyltransferase domain-containing protein [unclassified Aerococcus]KAB0646524.1 hypothetical protein F6I01_06515 [Aerococcus sanguinicola]MDK6233814.1 hypothetical protein [Aerococcus sp. UMB10185]MDK6855894.1 hypothetical protein [Aerococcus sp. UMB7533]OFN03937.1 hypothetical protein HMPREF2626_04790 [Aerococcus sp. HMSC062A02]OHO43506.1 hypothetical protein HMPREF2705_01785 [Aerococcus sp. HMSC035B07]
MSEMMPSDEEILALLDAGQPHFSLWKDLVSQLGAKDWQRAQDVLADTWPEVGDQRLAMIQRLKPSQRLASLFLLLPQAAERYKSQGLPLGILQASLDDLYLRERLYYEAHGTLGLTADDGQWLLRIFDLKIFKLGTLQFERTHWMNAPDYYHLPEEDLAFWPEGTPLLAVHIMEGSELSLANCQASFDQAEAFFSQHFPGEAYQAFSCFSWLLYPGLWQVLGEGSRIRQFASFFHLLASTDWPDMARARILDQAPTVYQGSRLQGLARSGADILGAGLAYRPMIKEERNGKY